jgi:cytochrome c biogenesis protein CcdA/thiol-disulfide isomerase/thioredoxin
LPWISAGTPDVLFFALAYLGGALTIISPCILPVLPFVFARADRPFVRSGLPLLVGMAVTFAGFASLAAFAGQWAVSANQAGRVVALVLLAAFGTALAFPAIADRATRPLVRWGGRLTHNGGDGVWASVLLGAATGLLWAPCAGPVLGLILTGAALGGTSASTAFLLVGYAAGAATSLAVALLAGGRVFARMKRSLHASERVRRVLGIAVLVSVVAIALGVDTGTLAKLSKGSTTTLEQGLIDRFGMEHETTTKAPSFAGATRWLNSRPLTAEDLRGKVVLVDFWTYSCVNCLRSLPYVRAWDRQYAHDGLVVVGVHSPEFAFERDPANVRKAAADLKVTYPIALDNDFRIWKAFHNQYWPAHYLIDARGRIRYQHFGEGNYAGTEQMIRRLLTEAGDMVTTNTVRVETGGSARAADASSLQSPETYLGSQRADRRNDDVDRLKLNEWGLTGTWNVGPESAVADETGAKVTYRFKARDLNMVLGHPAGSGRFKITVDGRAPGADHGMDVTPAGIGTVTGQRLYQLVRQHDGVEAHTFTIEFLDAGVEAYTFTFG